MKIEKKTLLWGHHPLYKYESPYMSVLNSNKKGIIAFNLSGVISVRIHRFKLY